MIYIEGYEDLIDDKLKLARIVLDGYCEDEIEVIIQKDYYKHGSTNKSFTCIIGFGAGPRFCLKSDDALSFVGKSDSDILLMLLAKLLDEKTNNNT